MPTFSSVVLASCAGTLFLDEIGDMPLHLQTRLLRVRSEHEVLPLGADRPIRVELPVIAASHRDLRQLIAAGSFREDLYDRLCGATLPLPALRDRRDLGDLFELILREEAEHLDTRAFIADEALELLDPQAGQNRTTIYRQMKRFGIVSPTQLPPEGERS
ncbi:Acetoin catabolism regulatory protein [Methylibium sp. T29]|nr:Acetoin catabolism regulatory protein [Methylibium sp. T29]EWS58753.1 Acetoin catabolism regulatory protein [Methylibium sp. T29-B]